MKNIIPILCVTAFLALSVSANTSFSEWANSKAAKDSLGESERDPMTALVFGTSLNTNRYDIPENGDMEALKALAKEGDPKAMYNFGVVCLRGIGRLQDSIEGVYWMEKAHEAGVPSGTHTRKMEGRFPIRSQPGKLPPQLLDGSDTIPV